MLKFRKGNEKGFTLIELLIVVAIIGILAAIAIPQFSSYRQKAYNSAALSDTRNAKTAEESLYADVQAYGATDGAAVLLTVAAPANAGAVNQGPMSAAIGGAVPAAGSRVSGTNNAGADGSVPFGVSNGVNILASASVDAVLAGFDSYVVMARHEQGDTAYGADSDNTTTVYRVSNPGWVGVNNVISATAVAVSVGVDGFNPGGAPAPGGGSPTTTWTLM